MPQSNSTTVSSLTVLDTVDAAMFQQRDVQLNSEIAESQFRYAAAVSESLRKQIVRQFVHQQSATDLFSELAIMRSLLERSLSRLSAADDMPQSNVEEQNKKLTAQFTSESMVRDAINEVANMAARIAKIQSGYRGQIDSAMLATLLSVISNGVDSATQDFAPQLTRVGIDPRELGLHIASTLDTAISGTLASNNRFSGPNTLGPVSSQPAQISADEILRAMLESVPLAPQPEQAAS